jgi:lipid II:glycine glycyltransferase (peptidoglycan interpeptide bridge formation enzyme)
MEARAPHLLQSAAWARVQEKEGREAFALSGGAQGYGFASNLPLVGAYRFFPRGPRLLSGQSEERARALLDSADGMVFLRIEPEDESALGLFRESFGARLRKAPQDVEPREVLVMDIRGEEEALLVRMKSKTRYNLRLAKKRGVRVRASRSAEDLECFFSLIQATARLKGLRTHPQSHYAAILAVFGENAELLVAESDGVPLAASLMVYAGETATYLHGGTSEDQRSLMAPYLLHWEAIRAARARGCIRYDWGGISESSAAPSDWAGITRFKRGFAPETRATVYPGTFDIVLNTPRYVLYRVLRALKMMLRK